MLKCILFVALFVLVAMSTFGQSTPSPTPTPVAVVSPSPAPTRLFKPEHLHFTVYSDEAKVTAMPTPAPTPEATPEPMPTPEASPTPAATVEPFKKGWEVHGGIDFVNRYHGSNGERFGGADQNLWFEAEYRFRPNFSAYCGSWYALQFKELDGYCGLRAKTGPVHHELQFQNLYLFDDGEVIKVRNPSYEISTTIVKRKRFAANLFARAEYYFTDKKDNLRPGAYFIAGVTTDTDLGHDTNLNLAFKVMHDHKGAFNTNPGSVAFVYGSVIKSWGRFSTGPTFKISTDLTTGNRPTLATVGWSFSF